MGLTNECHIGNKVIDPEYFEAELNYALYCRDVKPISISMPNHLILPRTLTKSKSVLVPEQIQSSLMVTVEDKQSPHLAFYLRQICDLYIGRCYLRPDFDLNLDTVEDITREIERLKKQRRAQFRMLVWGLKSDCELWITLTEHRVYFIDTTPANTANPTTIIPATTPTITSPFAPLVHPEYITPYQYPSLTISNSFTWKEPIRGLLPNFQIDRNLFVAKRDEKFDLILINDPKGDIDTDPGRLLPIYWAHKVHSHPETIIYLTNADGLLERFCIDNYLVPNKWKIISQNKSTVKLSQFK